MTDKRRKILYWAFKVSAIVISCLLPIWAICEKFPIWKSSNGAARSISVGAIFILIVMLIVFRKTVFEFITEKFNLKHAPPLVVWLGMLIVSYVLVFIGDFARDLTIIFWMGLIGCAIGTFLTFIAENYFSNKKENNNEQN